MAIDINKEIRRAVDTGAVKFGVRQSERSILNGKAQLIIIASNALLPVKEKFMQLAATAAVPYKNFHGTALELGSVCGKPFMVSVFAVEKAGKSKILETTKEKSGGKKR